MEVAVSGERGYRNKKKIYGRMGCGQTRSLGVAPGEGWLEKKRVGSIVDDERERDGKGN